MKDDHPVRTLCQALDVSPSGYYDWQQRQLHPGLRAQADQQLRQRLVCLHRQSRATYGSPRLRQALAQEGARHGRNRIARLMRLERLVGRPRARYRPRTTDSRHDQPIADNLLAQAPAPTGPNQVWVADITYLATAEGWLYLAALLDLYSRRIVGWAVSERLDTALVLAAWQQACTHRHPPPGLLCHSDRGVQYASAAYRHALALGQARPSMSRKACCYDNAAMESFWSTLKLELVYRRDFATRDQARAALFDYLEVFYNRQRLHSALAYQSPLDFESPNP
jgi:transposase InsO family protein